MHSTSRITVSALLNPENTRLPDIQDRESNSQSIIPNPSSQQPSIENEPHRASSKRNSATIFTDRMERELVNIAKDNMKTTRVDWQKVFPIFKRTFPGPEWSLEILRKKYYKLIKEKKSLPSSPILPQQIITSTISTVTTQENIQLEKSSRLENTPTVGAKKNQTCISFSDEMTKELMQLAAATTKQNSKRDWKKITAAFNDKYPNLNASKKSLQNKFNSLTLPGRIPTPQMPTSSTTSAANSQSDIQSATSSIEGTKKKKIYTYYSAEMTIELKNLVANTTRDNGTPDWNKITVAFNDKYPESHASMKSLQNKFDTLFASERIPTPQPISSQQIEIPTTNAANMQPEIPLENAEIQSATRTDVLHNKRKNIDYNDEMIQSLKELVPATIKANGKPDWNKITAVFNDKFPDIKVRKQALKRKYERLHKDEHLDQTLGIRPLANKRKKLRKITLQIEKDILRLGNEQHDQNKEIDWKTIAKTINSKYGLYRSENNYRSIFYQLNDSELTASDRSESEVSDRE